MDLRKSLVVAGVGLSLLYGTGVAFKAGRNYGFREALRQETLSHFKEFSREAKSKDFGKIPYSPETKALLEKTRELGFMTSYGPGEDASI